MEGLPCPDQISGALRTMMVGAFRFAIWVWFEKIDESTTRRFFDA